MDVFDKRKLATKSDKSPKGSYDAPIVELIHFINTQTDFFTTSSCSGRIVLFGDGNFIETWHEQVDPHIVIEAIERSQANYIEFKMEPFVMHLEARTLEHAIEILARAQECGFRNSGISMGKSTPRRIIVAIRGMHRLDIPIRVNGSNLFTDTFQVKEWTEIANERLNTNLERVHRLELRLKEASVK